MAIYTRYGSLVEIIGVDEDWNQEWVWVRYADDGREREVNVSDLKADEGIAEIDEAIATAPINK